MVSEKVTNLEPMLLNLETKMIKGDQNNVGSKFEPKFSDWLLNLKTILKSSLNLLTLLLRSLNLLKRSLF